MKKSEFIEQIAEYCEFDGGPFQRNTELQSIDGYDSMAVMTMIAFIDENFSTQLDAEIFRNLTDFNSLIEAIGNEKFEDE